MTKEELEKEAEKKAFSYAQLIPCSPYMEKRHREIDFEEGYFAGAEPREKRIAELEHQLTHRNCVDCSNHSSKLRMRTLELEKENAELKLKLEALEGQTPWKDIKDKSELIKENAELKERADKADLDSVLFFNQLCKAKEIIKEFVHHYKAKTIYIEDMKYLLEQAEQFLSEVEK